MCLESLASPIDFPALWKFVVAQFPLGKNSIHGPNHWRNVESNGLQLASDTKADTTIVRLFAVFHDSRRMNEWTDHEHGKRGGELARELRGKLFDLDDPRLETLVEACFWHERGRISGDATIGTCWDADRLDLPRVGIQPNASYLSTAAAKRQAIAGPAF